MKQNEPVKKIMTKDLTTINLRTTLSEAREIFDKISGQHLPVMDGAKIVGMLSYMDLMRVDSGPLYNQDPLQADMLLDNIASVKETMSENLETLPSSSSIKEATEILSERKFHSLPIVDNKKLVGLVTSTDLLRYYASCY